MKRLITLAIMVCLYIAGSINPEFRQAIIATGIILLSLAIFVGIVWGLGGIFSRPKKEGEE